MLYGWVVYTIKTTRSLHKSHIANLLIARMVDSAIGRINDSSLMISYQLEVEPIFSCTAIKFYFFPFNVYNTSFMIIAADKVLAITSPFKHKRMMTPCLITAVITGTWLLASIPVSLAAILDADGYTEVAEYGICLVEGAALLEIAVIYLIPLIIAPIFTISLNAYLAIKAC